jgi:hypothetical protein
VAPLYPLAGDTCDPARSDDAELMARPNSQALHRAKRKKQKEWADFVLTLVDHSLSEALTLLDAVQVIPDRDRKRIDRNVDRAARRVHVSRLILRDYLYDDADPD